MISINGEDDDGDGGATGFLHGQHGKAKISIHSSNLFQSKRIAASFLEDEVELTPTLLSHNVALVIDRNLIHDEQGRFYYKVDSFYNREVDPEYALTVDDSIYRRIINEIASSRNVPCGLYFCCHGGDGVNMGFPHEDYVDIRLAWSAIACIFAAMLGTAFY